MNACAVVLLSILAQTEPADEAKLRQRIDAMQREIERLNRELAELRSHLGEPFKAAAKTKELLASLHEDYETRLRATIDQEHLLQAARLLERGEIKEALPMLRKGRSPAAVPLLLHDLVRRESQPDFQAKDIAPHLTALTLLTGEEVEEAIARFGSAHRLTQHWLESRRQAFTTDLGKMSSDRVRQVARRLVALAGPIDAYKANGPSYYAHALIYRLLANRGSEDDSPNGRSDRTWFAEELHPALGPAFLAILGYRLEGAAGEDITLVPFELVKLLAALRVNGMMPNLDRVARDETQNSGLRLVCLMALELADEGVRVPEVVRLLAREKNLERRLIAMELLYYAKDLEPAADYLREALDDANAQVRRSALNALRRHPPPRLLKRLKEKVEAKHEEEVLEVIAAVGSPDAQQFLAAYLKKTMEDRPKIERIHDALWAFQRAVGGSWISAGSYSFDHYHAQAAKALEWWHKQP